MKFTDVEKEFKIKTKEELPIWATFEDLQDLYTLQNTMTDMMYALEQKDKRAYGTFLNPVDFKKKGKVVSHAFTDEKRLEFQKSQGYGDHPNDKYNPGRLLTSETAQTVTAQTVAAIKGSGKADVAKKDVAKKTRAAKKKKVKSGNTLQFDYNEAAGRTKPLYINIPDALAAKFHVKNGIGGWFFVWVKPDDNLHDIFSVGRIMPNKPYIFEFKERLIKPKEATENAQPQPAAPIVNVQKPHARVDYHDELYDEELSDESYDDELDFEYEKLLKEYRRKQRALDRLRDAYRYYDEEN